MSHFNSLPNERVSWVLNLKFLYKSCIFLFPQYTVTFSCSKCFINSVWSFWLYWYLKFTIELLNFPKTCSRYCFRPYEDFSYMQTILLLDFLVVVIPYSSSRSQHGNSYFTSNCWHDLSIRQLKTTTLQCCHLLHGSNSLW